MRPPRVTGCSWPWTRVIPSARPERSAVAKLPSGATTLGRIELQLPVEVRLAGCDLGGERVAVAGRPALEHRREVRVVEREADGSEQPLEELPRATGERPPVAVLVEPRRLAHEDEVRVRVPLAEDDLRAALGERAADAARGLGGRVAQR